MLPPYFNWVFPYGIHPRSSISKAIHGEVSAHYTFTPEQFEDEFAPIKDPETLITTIEQNESIYFPGYPYAQPQQRVNLYLNAVSFRDYLEDRFSEHMRKRQQRLRYLFVREDFKDNDQIESFIRALTAADFSVPEVNTAEGSESDRLLNRLNFFLLDADVHQVNIVPYRIKVRALMEERYPNVVPFREWNGMQERFIVVSHPGQENEHIQSVYPGDFPQRAQAAVSMDVVNPFVIVREINYMKRRRDVPEEFKDRINFIKR
jgi:hypothetical protein